MRKLLDEVTCDFRVHSMLDCEFEFQKIVIDLNFISSHIKEF